jgi:phenylalanyl-tRNA synthetase beta chain
MKVSLNWLRDDITLNDGVTVEAIVNGLIQLGHEVDAVHDAGGALKGVVIGKILERAPHPNADRLGVCKVDVGAAHGGARQIVCGAPNARAGLTVAVALPGAVLPGDFKIGASQIRGVESNGMICSLDQLGMATERAEGIWEMDTGAAVGTPLAEALGKGDTVLDVAVTPNRGDCLSHLGIARELAVLGLGTLKEMKAHSVGSEPCAFAPATKTPGCPQLNLLEMKGVANGESPAWLRDRLEAVGLRPKRLLVDVTNYVMMAIGQPMHAYDAAKLTSGGLTAKEAKGGESFKGLGDVALTLRAGDVAIMDGKTVVGLAGILGGAESAVSEATTHVVLEAATFDRTFIARAGQGHQLSTDARYRFERGVDPALPGRALAMAAEIIRQASGGTVSAIATGGKGVKAGKPITYQPSLCATFGGLDVPAARQREILEKLGFGVTGKGKTWKVAAPTFRTYMTNPEDIVEEVLRVVGFENVPAVLPGAGGPQTRIDGSRVALDRKARKALAAAGFLEGITYSFISRRDAEMFAGGAQLIDLDNPLAEDNMVTMRPSLLPGLLRAAASNIAHKDVTARLGEVGKVFEAKGEKLALAGVLMSDGKRVWRKNAAGPDVFVAKAAALQVLELLGGPVESGTVAINAGDVYHPGKSGAFKVGPFTLARFGELHPKVLKAFDLSQPVAVFEIELEPLLRMQGKGKAWQPLATQPVRRDVAFVLPQDVPAAAVQATLRGADRDLITGVEVFDMYVGDKVPAGKKSLALGLTLQAADRTLTDAEINAVVDKAVNAAKTVHQAELRA